MREHRSRDADDASWNATTVSDPLTDETKRRATVIGLVLIAIGVVAAFVGRDVATSKILAFLPSVTSIIIVTDTLSAYVFLGQYFRHGAPRLALLGVGYLCSAAFAIPYLLVFPGLFPVATILHADEQTSLFLWLGWHSLFPFFVALAMLRPARKTGPTRLPRRFVIGLLNAMVAALVLGTLAFVLHDPASLPRFMLNGHVTGAMRFGMLPAVVLLDVLALIAILRARPYAQTSAWLTVAMLAAILDAVMGLGFSRYTYGWYAGKVFSMVSASIVLIAYIRDMLNLQLALAKSRDALGRFEILSEHARDIMVFADRQTLKITDVNAAAIDAFGYTIQEFRGLTLQELDVPAERLVAISMFEHADEEDFYELVCMRKDGTSFPGEYTARTAVVDGRTLVLCVIRDITERRRAREMLTEALAEAVSASELKSEFVATMSHEIRTPMNGVIAMSEIVLAGPLEPAQRESVETIRDSGKALLRIINDVLDFSKIEAGKLDIEAVDVSVTNIVGGVVSLLDRDSKNVSVFTIVDPEIPRLLRGDPGRLRQVLLNIVGNAMKFTAAGSVVISAHREPSIDGRVVVRFTVQDTGIGMSRETVSRLFEPFVQADGSTTRRYGGTGLGLSIARRLIELMGGTIDVRSEPGIGTTFEFTTHFDEVAEPGVPPQLVEAGVSPQAALRSNVPESRPFEAPGRASLACARVLVVEDNEINRRVAAKQLQLLGYDFEIAHDGKEALEKVHARRFDLVLMDCYMPEMDGYETTAAMRSSIDPGVRDLAIVAMTASALERDRRRCLEAGMDDHVSKPVSLGSLSEVLVRQLSRRGLDLTEPIAG